MADFDAFGAGGKLDEDPAAEFLAREQQVLAGLDDEFDLPPASTQTSNGLKDQVDSLSSSDPLGSSSQTKLDANASVLKNGVTNGEAENEVNQLNGPTSKMSISPLPTSQQLREEPESIKKWREEQRKMLEEKDKEEEKRKEELKKQAKKELEEWYARYAEQLEKSKANNRTAEKEWIAERDAEKPGQEWEKIANLCDFNPKTSRNTKDTSRLKSIILQLKQNPPPHTLRKPGSSS